MSHKYLPANKGIKKWRAEYVKFGDDVYQRERYYAFLKHRSQARYRGEDYTLTWEDWTAYGVTPVGQTEAEP